MLTLVTDKCKLEMSMNMKFYMISEYYKTLVRFFINMTARADNCLTLPEFRVYWIRHGIYTRETTMTCAKMSHDMERLLKIEDKP